MGAMVCLGNAMKEEKLNEFLDTKKSKVSVEDIALERLNPFVDAMLYAEKHVQSQMTEARGEKEEDVEESDPEDPTQDELEIIQKSLRDRGLEAFLKSS